MSRLDLVTKSLRQHDPEFTGSALGIAVVMRQSRRKADKYDEAHPVVELEQLQALIGIIDIQQQDLPGQHDGGNKQT